MQQKVILKKKKKRGHHLEFLFVFNKISLLSVYGNVYISASSGDTVVFLFSPMLFEWLLCVVFCAVVADCTCSPLSDKRVQTVPVEP